MTKKKSGKGISRVYASRGKPIDRVAARVVKEKPSNAPSVGKLRKQAKMAKDTDEATRILKQIEEIEQAGKRAAKARDKRLISPAAVARARKALEAAKWRRNS